MLVAAVDSIGINLVFIEGEGEDGTLFQRALDIDFALMNRHQILDQ